MDHGCIQRVANQPGYGTESVRAWVRQADIDDGERPGVTSAADDLVRSVSSCGSAAPAATPQLPVPRAE